MAIAYGICDDEARAKTILDDIETQMVKEDLFFWPICLYSYGPGEGNDWQFPFPNYENGDIFLSWGSVAVKAYADRNPSLAVKYVKRVLAQYAKDGLAFQRYGRAQQDGRGDDILSGNGLSVVGLYQAIYGINPRYNRFYLDPHITPELAGTKLKYNYRDQPLVIDLDVNRYAVSGGGFKITAQTDFGFYASGNDLLYFKGDNHEAALKATRTSPGDLTLEIGSWTANEMSFKQFSATTAPGKITYQLNNLQPSSDYTVRINNDQKLIRANGQGTLIFEQAAGKGPMAITVLHK
jgi:hypothetical protein